MKKMAAGLAATAMAVAVSAPALAVGDPVVRLDKRQAMAAYARVRLLLTNDGGACPGGQVAVSGEVTGGGAPGLGSQTTTIAFDKGGTVRIVRDWGRDGAHPGSTTVTITCSWHPAG